jgi:colanic acid biosynthesis glycosyl transferase WcaI
MVKQQKRLRIAIVSQYFRPENAKIPNGLAAGLSERGHDVRVVTGYPNYPLGKLFPGFRQRLVLHEQHGRVRVRRVPIYVSHSQNPFARLANYASFGLSCLSASRFVRSADAVYVYATPMTAALAPAIWRRTRKTPFVIHVQDLWPESVTGSSLVRQGLIARMIGALLNPWLHSIYRLSSGVIAIAPTMQRILLDRGVDEKKIHTVLNWDDANPDIAETGSSQEPQRCSVVYAGNLGDMQDLETAVRAAAKVTDLDGFSLRLIGAGVAEARLRVLVAELGAENVDFPGPVPSEEMARVYAASDYQLVSLKDLAIFRGTIPSKFQASLAHGRPVITTVAGDVADIVQANGLGFVSAPEDADGLADVFRQAYATPSADIRSMGERARRYFATEMSFDRGVDRIEQILSDAADEARGNKQS